jgi:hypothetical protein
MESVVQRAADDKEKVVQGGIDSVVGLERARGGWRGVERQEKAISRLPTALDSL